jgi:hypothetical protein
LKAQGDKGNTRDFIQEGLPSFRICTVLSTSPTTVYKICEEERFLFTLHDDEIFVFIIMTIILLRKGSLKLN